MTYVEHRGVSSQMSDHKVPVYENRFRCVPAEVPFRPPRPARVLHQVTESAVVVGPAGQEIYTDSFGRVKVQLHWDREGKRNEQSSCWVRVAQGWAGAGWGFQFVPRIGMEVLVTFLGGDVDRPVVTGCLNNALNPVPYRLPEFQTKSGFKSRSTPASEGFNELSFDDAAGQELLSIHAEKDLHEAVGHDRGSVIGHDRTTTVQGSSAEEVRGSRTRTVGGGEVVTIRGASTLSVDGARTETMSGAVQTRTRGDRGVSTGGDENSDVGGDRKATVSGSDHVVAKVARSVIVGTSTERRGDSLNFVWGRATHQGDDRSYRDERLEAREHHVGRRATRRPEVISRISAGRRAHGVPEHHGASAPRFHHSLSRTGLGAAKPRGGGARRALGGVWLGGLARVKVSGVFCLALLGAGCGGRPGTPPSLRAVNPVATPGLSPREPPPSRVVTVTPVSVERLQRWAPPARLVSQYTSYGAMDISFDGPGLYSTIQHSHAVSAWRREAGSKDWKQVLREPWGVDRVTWKTGELLVCGREGAIKASFGANHAEWTDVSGEKCWDDGALLDPTSTSSTGRWNATVGQGKEHCGKPTMPDSFGRTSGDCYHDRSFVLEGPAGARTTLAGSRDSAFSMSPSGRFFVFQHGNGQVVVHETSTRETRPTDAVEVGYTSPTLRVLRWLPDESAFAIVFASGGIVFVSPRTGKTTWNVPRGKFGYLRLHAGTGEPWVGDSWDGRLRHVLVAQKGSASYPLTFPRDAERTLALPALRRTTALGKGVWALWDEDEGKVLRIMGGVVSFEPSPSGRFLAVLLDHCSKTVACGASVEVVDALSGATRWTLELPEVTTFTVVEWFGPADHEVLAVVDGTAQFLRPSDGSILHAEPPSTLAEASPVLWTEDGLVDASDAELKAWAFRPVGRLDRLVEATLLRHPGLWSDFREGRPLSAPNAPQPGTRGP